MQKTNFKRDLIKLCKVLKVKDQSKRVNLTETLAKSSYINETSRKRENTMSKRWNFIFPWNLEWTMKKYLS